MKESPRRAQLLDLLSPLHAVAIENTLEAGTPDVNCTAGWIEVKQLDDWPKRADTIVQPRHFKPEQRHWLIKRCQAGGRAWVLLCVGGEWCLCWGAAAAKHLGVSWKRSDLVRDPEDGVVRAKYGSVAFGSEAGLYWTSKPDSRSLIHALLIRHWS